MTDSSVVVRPTLEEKLALATFNFTKRSIAELLRQRKVLPESSFRPLSSRAEAYFELQEDDDHSKELARALHHHTVRASIINKSLKRLTVCVQAGENIDTLVEAYQYDFTYSHKSVNVVLKCGEEKIAEVEQSHLDDMAKSYRECLERIRENASKVKNPGLNALLEAEVIPEIYLRYDIVKKRCVLDDTVFRDDDEAKACADIVQNASRSREIVKLGSENKISTKVSISIPRTICDPPKARLGPDSVAIGTGGMGPNSSNMEDIESVSLSEIPVCESMTHEGDATMESVSSASNSLIPSLNKSRIIASNMITAAVLTPKVPSQPPASNQGPRRKRLEPTRSSRPTTGRSLDTSHSESVASNQTTGTTGTIGLNHRIEEAEDSNIVEEEVDAPSQSEASVAKAKEAKREKHAKKTAEEDEPNSKSKPKSQKKAAAGKRPRGEDVPIVAKHHAVENNRGGKNKRRKLKED